MGEFKVNVGTKLWMLSWSIHVKNRDKISISNDFFYSKKKNKPKILRVLIALKPVRQFVDVKTLQEPKTLYIY